MQQYQRYWRELCAAPYATGQSHLSSKFGTGKAAAHGLAVGLDSLEYLGNNPLAPFQTSSRLPPNPSPCRSERPQYDAGANDRLVVEGELKRYEEQGQLKGFGTLQYWKVLCLVSCC
jgi:hypothetical protein